MSKRIELEDNLEYFPDESLISLIGGLLTTIENIAYAYDIEDECCEDVAQVFDEHDIRYKIVEEDV